MTGAIRYLALIATLAACGSTPTPPAAAADMSTSTSPASAPGTLGLMNERHVGDRIITGGQPDEASLEAAEKAGVTTVINLRAAGEPGVDTERTQVEALGMKYVSIPIAGAADLTADNARAVDRAIEEAGSGRVLLHCGSGNRAGAMIGLRAFYVQGKSRSEALEAARAAGLTKLEPALIADLDRACEQTPTSPQCQ